MDAGASGVGPWAVTLTRASQRRANRLAKHRGIPRADLLAQLLTGALKEADADLTDELAAIERERQEREAWLQTPSGQRAAKRWAAMRQRGIRHYTISPGSDGAELRIEREDNTTERRYVTPEELRTFLAEMAG